MKTAISNVAPGQVVKFHGEPCIVLEHRTAGTLLVTAAQIKSSFGSTNNFAASSFREHLNGAFADALTEGHADELITREVDLTALNGSREYRSCECNVAPLTFDEIRRFHGLLPKPESWEWSATPWSTPCVNEDDMEKACRRKGKRTTVYYCHPHAPHERGSNENMNRIIRRFFPKGTNFDEVPISEIRRAEEWMNNYPREVLGWQTAATLLRSYMSAC